MDPFDSEGVEDKLRQYDLPSYRPGSDSASSSASSSSVVVRDGGVVALGNGTRSLERDREMYRTWDKVINEESKLRVVNCTKGHCQVRGDCGGNMATIMLEF